jgi:protein-disulfide isomerase
LIITRRAFTAALSLTGLATLTGLFSPLRLISGAMAQTAADVAKPVSLPDMALGPANAPVTITEFASMTCPHCAAFNAEVFPKIKSTYIDTGKVRYIFRSTSKQRPARCWRAASPKVMPANTSPSLICCSAHSPIG